MEGTFLKEYMLVEGSMIYVNQHVEESTSLEKKVPHLKILIDINRESSIFLQTRDHLGRATLPANECLHEPQ